MRLLVTLAVAVAYVAAGGSCPSNCTQNILNICTPRFQWEETGEGTWCYLLNLAPPQAELWSSEGACEADIADYNMTNAQLYAWTTNFTVVDNTLTFETNDDCGIQRRAGETVVLSVQFLYAGSSTAPSWCGSGCARKLKLYTDFPNCQTSAPNDNDNDVASTWRPGSSGGSRRSRTSSRRGSWSGRSSNSESSNDNGGTRRVGGCPTSPLFGINVTAEDGICQLGQCCGSNFCNRDRALGDCLALEETAGWRVGSICGDETCTPVYPGEGNGAGGADVELGSNLEFAEGALPVGGHLVIQTRDVNEAGAVPAFNGGEVLIAFDVDRETFDGLPIEGPLPEGQYILVTIKSEALDGGEILLLRWDVDSNSWVNSVEEDCSAVNVEITFDQGTQTYTAPVCHTSTFIVTSAGDSKDKKGKKGVKVTKKTKPTKGLKETKAPKDVKKGGKKGKTEVAIGVGVAGAAVALAGVGVLVSRSRRNNKAKKSATGTATPASSEIAVVSV